MTLTQLLAYDHWANKRLYVQLFSQNVTYKAPQAIDIFVHMLCVQKLWCNRIEGLEDEPELWPKMELGSSEAIWLSNRERLKSSLVKTTELVAYTDEHGARKEDSVQDILHELTLNSAHYRGQIAMLMKQQSLSPPPISYIDYLNTLR